jgi:membrane protein
MPESSAAPTTAIDWRSTDDMKSVGRELFDEFKEDDVTTLAAAVAFHTVFAIPALLILIVLAAAMVNRVTDIDVLGNIRDLIQDHAPGSSQQLLNEQVDSAIAQVGGGALSIGFIVTAVIALWSGSNAVGALIIAFNKAYGAEESRPFPKKKGVAVGLTLFITLFISVAFALLVFGERIGSWTADQVEAGSAFDFVWNLARWPFAVVAIALLMSVLYYIGPNVAQSFRWISPGSVLATLLWLIATTGFGIYLRFSNPGSAYGAVGSVLVLLFFLYVTAIIFITGAELNAVVARRNDPKVKEDLASQQGAAVAEPASAG